MKTSHALCSSRLLMILRARILLSFIRKFMLVREFISLIQSACTCELFTYRQHFKKVLLCRGEGGGLGGSRG